MNAPILSRFLYQGLKVDFMPTDMEAFLGRGKGDLFASHDLEDIIYLLDRRSTIQEEIMTAPKTVKTYSLEQFNTIVKLPLFEEALLGHVEQQDAMQRVKRLLMWGCCVGFLFGILLR